jgi:hypothetical protein
MKKHDEILLATKPKPLTLFDYQPVFCYCQNRKFLRSVNILFKGKILKKLYLDSYHETSEEADINETIAMLLKEIFTEVKQQTKKKNKTENKVARENAAKELFETLNL